MDGTIYCLVDAQGRCHVKEGAESYAEVAAQTGLDEATCKAYRFNLATRQLTVDRGTPASDRVVRQYLADLLGTPEALMQLADRGRFPKLVLTELLRPASRPTYLQACAAIERRYTEECTAKRDPCLEPGCAVEGDICLQPLLHAGVEYHQACGAAWVKLFADAMNRIDVWQH